MCVFSSTFSQPGRIFTCSSETCDRSASPLHPKRGNYAPVTFKKTCFPDLNELKCDVHIGHGDASVMLKVTTLWSSLCVST